MVDSSVWIEISVEGVGVGVAWTDASAYSLISFSSSMWTVSSGFALVPTTWWRYVKGLNKSVSVSSEKKRETLYGPCVSFS